MNTSRSWSCLYFLFFLIVQERCDACDWMINQYSIKSRFCLSQLKEMGGDMISVNGPFPHLAYSEVDKAKTEDKVRFLAEATEEIIILFDTVLSHVDDIQWDNRAVEHFLKILSRQLIELQKCTEVYAGRAGRSSAEKKLRRHFEHLKTILKKSHYSTHALEQIRSVVKHHLIRMDFVAANVMNRTG